MKKKKKNYAQTEFQTQEFLPSRCEKERANWFISLDSLTSKALTLQIDVPRFDFCFGNIFF